MATTAKIAKEAQDPEVQRPPPQPLQAAAAGRGPICASSRCAASASASSPSRRHRGRHQEQLVVWVLERLSRERYDRSDRRHAHPDPQRRPLPQPPRVEMPASQLKAEIARILKRRRLYPGLQGDGDARDRRGPQERAPAVPEARPERRARITGIQRVSRPAAASTSPSTTCRRCSAGLGVSILTTSHGVMTGRAARRRASAARSSARSGKGLESQLPPGGPSSRAQRTATCHELARNRSRSRRA